MEEDDRSQYAVQRASEVASPLIAEIAERLGIDLSADNEVALRMLSDFASRLFDAGRVFGSADAVAQVIEKLPGATVNVSPAEAPRLGPLGEGLEFDAQCGPNGLLPPERLRCSVCGGVGYYRNPPGQMPLWHICQACNGRGTSTQQGPVRDRPESDG